MSDDRGSSVPTGGGPTVRVYGWQWGDEDARRPRLSWIGVFLVVFGALLILENSVYGDLGNIAVLAAGLASLLAWVVTRGTVALYFGAFLMAAAIPGTYEAVAKTDLGAGWGTLAFGIALLFIAFVRAAGRGGWGWQTLAGGALVLLASTEIAVPQVGDYALPALLIVLGLLLLLRGGRGG
ncbi:MAG: hypothetical protein L0227_03405 [Chloroflexi bacterium]|nr:hypothetical protein [Chloroflexota bacterium]